MIYVLGSINSDIVFELERFPKRNETEQADYCVVGMGGKGANQAVAIAKLGNRDDAKKPAVRLISQLGKDAVGDGLIKDLETYGVDTRFIRRVNKPTGMAFVARTPKDNRIIVYGGANSGISKTDIDEALDGATSSDTLLCQLEMPLYVVQYALRKARSLGMTTILNPSPAKELPAELFFSVDILVLNEFEAYTLTGLKVNDFNSQKNVMRLLHTRGVQCVALTLGEDGVAYSDGSRLVGREPARKVTVEDTSGAGDVFVGALALTYPHIGMYSFREACIYANRAASLAVMRHGDSAVFPTRDEVWELYSNEIK